MLKQIADEWIKKLAVPKDADIQINCESIQITVWYRPIFKKFIEKFEALTEEYEFKSWYDDREFRLITVINAGQDDSFEIVVIYDYSDDPDFSLNYVIFDGLMA